MRTLARGGDRCHLKYASESRLEATSGGQALANAIQYTDGRRTARFNSGYIMLVRAWPCALLSIPLLDIGPFILDLYHYRTV